MKKISFLVFLCFISACSNLPQGDYSVMQQTAWVGPVVNEVTGKGIIIDLFEAKNMVSISHGPIPEMNWPPMLMKFKVENNVSLKDFHKGDRVFFDLEIDAANNYRVNRLRMQNPNN